MGLPKTSRSYPAEIEELTVGKGDYAVGGARSPAFLDLDNCRRRRPVIFGEVFDTLSGYHESAASMFSGRQTDIEEWSVMWKELGADGICLRLSDGCDPGIVKRISDRTRLPIMVSASTDLLSEIAGSVDDTILILKCRDRQQSLEMSSRSNNHIVTARCDEGSPQELCRKMSENGAKNIVTDLGDGHLAHGLDQLRRRIEEYRLSGLEGDADSRHPIICDVSNIWGGFEQDVTARRASMHEATAALSVMMSGADILVMKGPGAADMARVYGEELADL